MDRWDESDTSHRGPAATVDSGISDVEKGGGQMSLPSYIPSFLSSISSFLPCPLPSFNPFILSSLPYFPTSLLPSFLSPVPSEGTVGDEC